MALARRVYIGEVKSIQFLNADCPGSGPHAAFQWKCSCGETNSTALAKRHPKIKYMGDNFSHYTNKHECERSLDKHLESHNTQRPASEKADPVIAAEGAPQLGDTVEGVAGTLWLGKRGKVVSVSPNAPYPQDHISVRFIDEIDVPAAAFAPVHTHEDDQDAIERPPDNDATHDAQHRIPIDQGNRGHALDHADNLHDTPRMTQDQMELLWVALDVSANGRRMFLTKHAEQEMNHLRDRMGLTLHSIDPDRWVERR